MDNATYDGAVSPLIVGGQGSYQNGRYYTEFPDRALALDHMAEVANVIEHADYNCVVCSGGFTKAETPDLSEAKSFLNYWQEIQRKPKVDIVHDEVALDSAENVVFGLMALRKHIGDRPMKRICFYSLWQFKKPRMTALAQDLGIIDHFYFRAFTDERKANAGPAALAGEQDQFEQMKLAKDFLLRRPSWRDKRIKRYKGQRPYSERHRELKDLFPEVFEAWNALIKTPVVELQNIINKSPEMAADEALESVRKDKIARLQTAFLKYVVKPV